MSESSEDSARPAKRARLDHNAAPSLSSVPVPQAAPRAPEAAIDEDLEREVRAGIREYVCPSNLGFRGVLKQRYTDFLVNEIGQDGVVVHLRSLEMPRREKKAGDERDEKTLAEEEKVKKVVVKKEVEEEIRRARDDARNVQVKVEDMSDQKDMKMKLEEDVQEEIRQALEEEVC
jgi:tRNA pseudouridine13 synthase